MGRQEESLQVSQKRRVMKKSPDFKVHDRDKPLAVIPGDSFLLPRKTSGHHTHAPGLENNQHKTKCVEIS